MPPARFEPAIPAMEMPQTYSQDRTITRIGHQYNLNNRNTQWLRRVFLVQLLVPTHCKCRGLLLHLITLNDIHTR